MGCDNDSQGFAEPQRCALGVGGILDKALEAAGVVVPVRAGADDHAPTVLEFIEHLLTGVFGQRHDARLDPMVCHENLG